MSATTHSSRKIVSVLMLALTLGVTPVTADDRSLSSEQRERTLTLLHESLLWIRHQADDAPTAAASGTTASVPVPVRNDAAPAAIPLSSVAARDRWIGQNFYLRGEDYEAAQADRVRVGFEKNDMRLPGLKSSFSVDYNWSTSQQPGDTTMDMGLAWEVPLGKNQFAFRGRFHEYEDTVDSADVKRVGGTRQTLEVDLSRNLYRGDHSALDAQIVTTDVSHRWYEDGTLSDKSRRSYSLIRLDGSLDSYLPLIGAHGDLGFTVEGCVALMDGTDQESCGEKLGAFQRYNLEAGLQRQWLNMDWDLRGEYQFTPDKLPSWRHLEVGPGMIHGFGGQVMRGREGGWLRLDTETRSRLLWSPFKLYTNVRFSFLRGWAEAAAAPHATSRASVAEVLWRVHGDTMSGGVRAGTLLDSAGPGIAATNVPDVSVNLSWTL